MSTPTSKENIVPNYYAVHKHGLDMQEKYVDLTMRLEKRYITRKIVITCAIECLGVLDGVNLGERAVESLGKTCKKHKSTFIIA